MSVIVDAQGRLLGQQHEDLVEAAQRGDLATIAAAVRSIVRDSLASHPMRHETQAELKRRADVCIKAYEQCRGDLGWPMDRSLSAMRRALRSDLDGVPWDPNTESTLYRVDEGIEPFLEKLRAAPAAGPEAARLN